MAKTVITEREHKSIYREGDTIVKIFDETYTKADVLNEALNLARVEAIDINTPELLDVSKIDGKWAIVTNFIEGKNLKELMKEDKSKENEYLEMFVDLQLKIHAQRCRELTTIKAKMNRKISASKYEATIRYDLHNRVNGMKNHEKVLHGDFCPENVMVTPDGELYVIDWAHVTQGNASEDAARTYLDFILDGKKKLGEKYLKMFCLKADIPVQLVQAWMPVVACSESTKNIAKEQELLDSWVNVFDFQ